MEVLFLLFGLAALLAVAGTISDGPEAEPEPPEDDENERSGTDGDDIMFSDGGEILRGLDGDDTLITSGDSTLLGGEGDDTLVSFGGGALLNGGAGEDTFVINLLGVTDEGDLLDVNGQPVAPTVIDDFNPDQDQLVIDLRNSGLLPDDGAPVVLTGVVAPDGEGLMIQVNGVNAVQLSTYGGGDMQAALESLVNDFDALEIVGADFEFPPQDLGMPEGVEIIENPDGSLSFVITDDYAGGGELIGAAGRADILDLSQFSGNASIIEDDEGNIYLHIEGDDAEPTLLTNITSVILGAGENVVNVGSVPGGFTVTATDGTNDISAWRGVLTTSLLGGTNTVFLADGGNLNLWIGGGDNTITADEFVRMRVTMLEGAGGTTMIAGGDIRDTLRFLGSEPELLAVMTESAGLNATWAGGSLEMERVWSIYLRDGATLDATALDPDLSIGDIFVAGPNATVIGGPAPLFVEGQGQFLGGPGNDAFGVYVESDGGAVVDGGAGDDGIYVYQFGNFSGDIVLTGGEGQDQFYLATSAFSQTSETGVVRITDFADDESLRIDFGNWGPTPDMPEFQITIIEDAEANQVEIRLGERTLVILENRSSVPEGAIRAFDAQDL